MTKMTTAEMVASTSYPLMDVGAIEAAGRAAGVSLSTLGYAMVDLQPDDGTRYCISLCRGLIFGPGGYSRSKEVWVALMGIGLGYEWAGAYMAPEYATSKWSLSENLHTGTIMAAFLNAVNDHLVPGFWDVKS